MSWERLANAALVATLLAVGAVGWWLQLRPALVADPRPLRSLKVHVEGFSEHDIPLDQAIEAALSADLNLQRGYRGPRGEIVWLYVGYYGTARGGRPEHTPRGCYLGAGWAIDEARVIDVAPGLRVNEFRVSQDGHDRLVHFWYRSYRSANLVGGLDQNLDRMWGRLLEGRADGALVRVSTPIAAGRPEEARARLKRFDESLDALLGDHWPVERVP